MSTTQIVLSPRELTESFTVEGGHASNLSLALSACVALAKLTTTSELDGSLFLQPHRPFSTIPPPILQPYNLFFNIFNSLTSPVFE